MRISDLWFAPMVVIPQGMARAFGHMAELRGRWRLVTELSVPRVVSLMMGTWFLATAFSEVLAAQFGKLAAIEVPHGEAMDVAAAAAKYADLFWMMMWIGLGCALLALLVTPVLKRMMRGKH